MCLKMSLLSHSLEPFFYLLILLHSPKAFLEGVHKFKKLCHFTFKGMSCHESSCVKFQEPFLSRSSPLFSLTEKAYQLKMVGISISYSISSNLAVSGQLAVGGGGAVTSTGHIHLQTQGSLEKQARGKGRLFQVFSPLGNKTWLSFQCFLPPEL